MAARIYLVPRFPHPRADGDEPYGPCRYQGVERTDRDDSRPVNEGGTADAKQLPSFDEDGSFFAYSRTQPGDSSD